MESSPTQRPSRARIMLRPPRRPSAAAQALRSVLRSCLISRRESIPRQYSVILNYGNASTLTLSRTNQLVVNKPEAVARAINKLASFNAWSGIEGLNIPKFYTTKPASFSSSILLARTSLTGSSGQGIVVVRNGDAIPDAPLYVEYLPKVLEYRVHVVNKQPIFIQQKKRRSDNEQSADEKLIRSYDNGWVFCLVDLDEARQDIKEAACLAIESLGLDFGACDIIIHRDSDKPYILEVNTAPGIESPSLLAAYKEAFESWLLPEVT